MHCDVSGAYVQGGSNRPDKISISRDKEAFEKEKIDVVRQGWFQSEELSIYEYEPNVKIAAKMLGIGFPLQNPEVFLRIIYHKLV